MSYVDEKYYIETFKGTIVPTSLFDKFSQIASNKIRLLTLYKSDNYATTNEIKNATCALMEIYYEEENNEKDITSESADGYNVSYALKTKEQMLFDAAFEYLGHTGLLGGLC